MTTCGREIEFKFAVADKQAFRRLLAYLNLPDALLDQGVKQTNHFFDSTTFCLRHHGLAIRLRHEAGRYRLTLKAEQQASEQAVLSDRVEHEVALPNATALALLHGTTSPRRVIRQHFDDSSSTILELIHSACVDAPLVHVGEFINERINLPPISLPVVESTASVVFELDTSKFPNGVVDHEFEVEISEDQDATAIEAALIELLEQAGIPWSSAPSKAKRFFSAIITEQP
jgi:uncharacterized protein YjbK